MANSFWNFVTTLTAGTLAKAEDVNTNLSGVQTGFDDVEAEINKAIQITNAPGTVDIGDNAAARANKIIAFDAAGNVTASQSIGVYVGNHAAAAGTDYGVRDIVKDSTGAIGLNNIYYCNTTHTSTGDLATDSAYWDLLVDAAAAASSAAAAAASASTATTQAGLASTSASDAATEVTYAEQWANRAEDSLIPAAAGGDEVDDYSAKHFANKAAASAAAAETADNMEIISDTEASGASDTISASWTAGDYDYFEVRLIGLVPQVDSGFTFYLSTNSGTSYISSTFLIWGGDDVGGDGAGSDPSAAGISGIIRVYDGDEATKRKMIFVDTVYEDDNNQNKHYDTADSANPGSAINAMKIVCSGTGTDLLNSGRVIVYGHKVP